MVAGELMELLLKTSALGGLAFFGLLVVPVDAANDLVADQAIFQSRIAQVARSDGSPVGPPVKVTLCHNGVSISVAEPAVAAHLAHGDLLGPCQ